MQYFIVDGIESLFIPLTIFKSIHPVYGIKTKTKKHNTYSQLCHITSTINNKKIGLCYLKFENISYDSE